MPTNPDSKAEASLPSCKECKGLWVALFSLSVASWCFGPFSPCPRILSLPSLGIPMWGLKLSVHPGPTHWSEGKKRVGRGGEWALGPMSRPVTALSLPAQLGRKDLGLLST